MQRCHWLAALVWCAGLTGVWGDNAGMSVQVRDGQLRQKPSFLGAPAGSVAYGDRVLVLTRQGPWVEVRTERGTAGWIHESALTTKTVVLKAGAENVGAAASSEELALAGKGFNKEVEAQFKANNADVDFAWVDRMGTYTVDRDAMIEFLREGGVNPQGGIAP